MERSGAPRSMTVRLFAKLCGHFRASFSLEPPKLDANGNRLWLEAAL